MLQAIWVEQGPFWGFSALQYLPGRNLEFSCDDVGVCCGSLGLSVWDSLGPVWKGVGAVLGRS